MSARDTLMSRLAMVVGSYSPQRDRELIDAFAHELAEQIRAMADQYVGSAYDGAHAAANLIDLKEH